MVSDTEIGKDDNTPTVVTLPPMVEAPEAKSREPKPLGAKKPSQSPHPPTIHKLPQPIPVITETSIHDDAVTRRVWLNPAFQKVAEQREKAATHSSTPKTPPARKQTIYPPPRPGALRPPVTVQTFGIDDDAVTQEIKINQILSVTRNSIGWKKRSSIPPAGSQSARDGRHSTIPPDPETKIVSERPTYLGGLALANKRVREGERKRTSSIIPAIQLSIKSIVARLLKSEPPFVGQGESVDVKRSVFSFFRSNYSDPDELTEGEEILKGINPKLLRAAAQDKNDAPETSGSDEEWRRRVESEPPGHVQSFLHAPYTPRSASQAPPHIMQEKWPRFQRGHGTPKSAYKIAMGGGPVNGSRVGGEGDGRFSMTIAEPPKIHLKGALFKRRGREMLLIRGRAEHPIRVKDIMVFADKQKILYLSSASREDAGFIEFSADVPLENHTNHILVVARHDDDVMGSQSLFIRRDRSHQIDPRAVSPLRSVK